jgi:hypothetical protein
VAAREIDPVDQLELQVAVAASEERSRHAWERDIEHVLADVRRDIKLYTGLGVLAGNAVAAVVISKFGPASQIPAAARHVVRLLPL